MEHGMLWVEYSEWRQFYELEPWGIQVEDDRWTKLINFVRWSAGGEDFEWKPAAKLFPRSEADIQPTDAEPELDVGVRLRAMFQARNERLAAQDGQQEPSA